MAFEDDYLASVLTEAKTKPKKPTQLVPVQNFLTEKFGNVQPLPTEYNKAVDEYVSTFSDIAVVGAIGARPKRGTLAYDKLAAEKQVEFLAAVNQYAPKHKLLSEMSTRESDEWIKNFIAWRDSSPRFSCAQPRSRAI